MPYTQTIYTPIEPLETQAELEQVFTSPQGQTAAILNVDACDLAHINNIAHDIRSRFKYFVVLGMGGSSLCPQSFTAIAEPNHTPKIFYIDNIDPVRLEETLQQINVADTAFLAISKSGGTIETLSQILICIDYARKVQGDDISDQFYILTEPKDSPLRHIGEQIGATFLEHHKGISGRYSIFTNVGLLPAAVCGINIKEIIRGAKDSLASHKEDAGRFTALMHQLGKQGIRNHVTMPYAEKLVPLMNWYRQILAESLGKNGQGCSPINAMGTIDQHSQLQLYLDGPKDKLFTLMTTETKSQGVKVNTDLLAGTDYAYLTQHHLGTIMDAAAMGTMESLIANGRSLRHIHLDTVNAYHLGGLAMQFILEIIVFSALLKVDPFDQPAVEEGKNITKKMLQS